MMENEKERAAMLTVVNDEFERDRTILQHEPFLGWKIHKFPALTAGIDGLRPGLMIVSAGSNIGKTTTMVNLILGVLEVEIEPEILYFSFDDTVSTLSRYFLSRLSGVPQNDLCRVRECEPLFKKIEAARETMQRFVEDDRLRIYRCKYFHEMEAIIKAKCVNAPLASSVVRNKVCVFIDNVNNIEFPTSKKSELANEEQAAMLIKLLSVNYNIPVTITGEIRKAQHQQYLKDGEKAKKRDLNIGDLAGSKRWAYVADVVILLQPEDDNEFDDSVNIKVRIDAKIAKNKHGALKGKRKWQFNKNTATLVEQGWNEAPGYLKGTDKKLDSLKDAIDAKTKQGGSND